MADIKRELKRRADPNCRGSFRLGTACGECPRCKAQGYTPEKRDKAIKAEAERTAKLPPDRVKKNFGQPQVIVQIVQPESVSPVTPTPVEPTPVEPTPVEPAKPEPVAPKK